LIGMHRPALLLAVAASALALTACGSKSKVDVTSSAPAESTAPATADCSAPPTAAPNLQKFEAEPKLTVKPGIYTATIVTNCGTITMDLDGEKAPHTVNSFAFLAGKKYFDNTRCHRLTSYPTLSVLQCGDPTATGTGGPGYRFADENLDGATYPKGTVAMANSGPDTNGSQFFLVYADSDLPPKYTPFGKVTSGMDVLEKIAAAGIAGDGQDGAPKAPVAILEFTVKPAS
jgi:peptidyl-prolyl cis-trans isomerase B (cyclophilin B)